MKIDAIAGVYDEIWDIEVTVLVVFTGEWRWTVPGDDSRCLRHGGEN
jgi:hypothetical protein